MSATPEARIPGQLDLDEVLELVVRKQAMQAAVRGELAAPALELVERWTSPGR